MNALRFLVVALLVALLSSPAFPVPPEPIDGGILMCLRRGDRLLCVPAPPHVATSPEYM